MAKVPGYNDGTLESYLATQAGNLGSSLMQFGHQAMAARAQIENAQYTSEINAAKEKWKTYENLWQEQNLGSTDYANLPTNYRTYMLDAWKNQILPGVTNDRAVADLQNEMPLLLSDGELGVATDARKNQIAQLGANFKDQVASATKRGDSAQLTSVVQSSIESGIVDQAGGMDALQNGMYQINLDKVRKQAFSLPYDQAIGFLQSGDFSWKVNDITDRLSQDDVIKVVQEVQDRHNIATKQQQDAVNSADDQASKQIEQLDARGKANSLVLRQFSDQMKPETYRTWMNYFKARETSSGTEKSNPTYSNEAWTLFNDPEVTDQYLGNWIRQHTGQNAATNEYMLSPQDASSMLTRKRDNIIDPVIQKGVSIITSFYDGQIKAEESKKNPDRNKIASLQAQQAQSMRLFYNNLDTGRYDKSDDLKLSLAQNIIDPVKADSLQDTGLPMNRAHFLGNMTAAEQAVENVWAGRYNGWESNPDQVRTLNQLQALEEDLLKTNYGISNFTPVRQPNGLTVFVIDDGNGPHEYAFRDDANHNRELVAWNDKLKEWIPATWMRTVSQQDQAKEQQQKQAAAADQANKDTQYQAQQHSETLRRAQGDFLAMTGTVTSSDVDAIAKRYGLTHDEASQAAADVLGYNPDTGQRPDQSQPSNYRRSMENMANQAIQHRGGQ